MSGRYQLTPIGRALAEALRTRRDADSPTDELGLTRADHALLDEAGLHESYRPVAEKLLAEILADHSDQHPFSPSA